MAREITQAGTYTVIVQADVTLTLPEHFGHVTDETVILDPGTGDPTELVEVTIDGVRSSAIEQYLDTHPGVVEYTQVAPII